MKKRYKKRLSLKMFLFCFIYTITIIFIIFYSANKTTTVTTNITNVKSIESFRLKNKEEIKNYNEGILSYINKEDLNCLEDNNKILNNKYNDSLYGEVLILKTNDYYSCNTIIKMSTSDNQYLYGIVLDRDNKQDLNSIQIIENNLNNQNYNNKNITYKIERFGN